MDIYKCINDIQTLFGGGGGGWGGGGGGGEGGGVGGRGKLVVEHAHDNRNVPRTSRL